MYEKIVNYFETNLCVNNIYFRKKYLLWLIGSAAMLISELLINKWLAFEISNMWWRLAVIVLIDVTVTLLTLWLIYIIPVNKIYKDMVKEQGKIDFLGTLMNEEVVSSYREVEIKKMSIFLKKCKLNTVESVNEIITMIDKEIEEKYNKKSFLEKYFSSIILPLLVVVLTIYFTNTNEQNLADIVSGTLISVFAIIVAFWLISKLKNINITPVRKKDNLLELRRVLIDIKIKMQNN